MADQPGPNRPAPDHPGPDQPAPNGPVPNGPGPTPVDAAVSRRFRNAGRLLDHGRAALRADALRIAAAALDAVDPPAALRRIVRISGERLLVRDRPWEGLRPPPAGDDGRAGERPPDAGRAEEWATELSGRRVFLVGAGKASVGMAAVLDELLGPRLADAAVVVKHGQRSMLEWPLRHIELLEASHPVPDETSLAAGRRLLAVAAQARPGDLVIGIVTGGSSSLAVAPAVGISLEDKIATNRLLLACGADIVAINNVRKHLSAIKGGLLARACGAAAGAPGGCQIVNFTVSDVVGDPLDYVTDLTVSDRSTWAMARETCDRYDLWERLPAAVVARLRAAPADEETPKELPSVQTWVVADAAGMCRAAAGEARRLGYRPRLLGLDWEGEARTAGHELARLLRASPPGTCLLAGGENTVTLSTASPVGGEVPGGGNSPVASPPAPSSAGGPSQEAAVAAALELAGAGRPSDGAGQEEPTAEAEPHGRTAVVLCMDSDGTDGPTEAAGGLVDDLTAGHAADSDDAACRATGADETAGRAVGPGGAAASCVTAAAPDLATALDEHRTHDALAARWDLVLSGPTGTNVNDLRVALTAAADDTDP